MLLQRNSVFSTGMRTSAIGEKADIPIHSLMSAYDPKRTQGRRRFLAQLSLHLDKVRYAPC